MSFLKKHWIEIIIVIVTVIISLVFFTPEHDDYGSLLISMISGQYSNFAYFDQFWLGMFGVSYLYKQLQTLFPIISWMGSLFFLQTAFAHFIFLFIVNKTLSNHGLEKWIVRLIQIWLSLLFIENYIIISHTRFSLMYCGLAFFYFSNFESKSVIKNLFVALFALVGMLHRPESSLGMLVIISLSALIDDFHMKRFLQRIKIPLALVTLLYAYITIDRLTTNDFVKLVEPEIEYKFMAKQVVGLSEMKTTEDSLKYQVALNGMWFDPHVITAEYMRSLILPQINTSITYIKDIFVHLSRFYFYYLTISIFFPLILLLLILLRESARTLYKPVLFIIFSNLVIFALDYNGKLVDGRHFLNLQLVCILIVLSFFMKAQKRSLKPLSVILLFVGIIIIISVSSLKTLVSFKVKNNDMCSDVNCYNELVNKFEADNKNRLVVLTTSNIFIMNQHFSFYTKKHIANQYIMYDVFTYSLMKDYENYLNSICSCTPTNPIDFFNWLSKNNAIYIAQDLHTNLAEKYMNYIHHYPLHLKPINIECPACIHEADLRNVTISTVVKKEGS